MYPVHKKQPKGDRVMQISSVDRKNLRLPAWMLALSVVPYIATVVTGVVGFIVSGDLPLGVTFNEITPQIMSEIRATWVLLNFFVFIAVLNITLGSIQIARAIRDQKSRPWMRAALVLNVVIILQSALGTVVKWSVINFTEATLAANGLYSFANTLNIFLSLPFLAMLALCIGLAASGALRKTSMVIGSVSALLFVLALFPEVSKSMPPFIFGLIAMPVGVGLLLKERRAVMESEVAVSAI
jgi:hypothetical protein